MTTGILVVQQVISVLERLAAVLQRLVLERQPAITVV
jgi:hypothetical protein